MNKLTGLLVLIATTNIAYADVSPDKAAAQTHQKVSRIHAAPAPVAGNPVITRKITLPIAASDVETLTVTGVRHRNLDLSSEQGLTISPAAPRALSDPLAVDVVTRPVLVTLQTGNTEALRDRSVIFPFQSTPDRSGRDTEFLRFRLAHFGLD